MPDDSDARKVVSFMSFSDRISIKIYYTVSFVQVLMLLVISVISLHSFNQWKPGTMTMLATAVRPAEYRDFIKEAYAQTNTLDTISLSVLGTNTLYDVGKELKNEKFLDFGDDLTFDKAPLFNYLGVSHVASPFYAFYHHLTTAATSPITAVNTSWAPLQDRYDWCYETGLDMYMLSLTFGAISALTVILVLIFWAISLSQDCANPNVYTDPAKNTESKIFRQIFWHVRLIMPIIALVSATMSIAYGNKITSSLNLHISEMCAKNFTEWGDLHEVYILGLTVCSIIILVFEFFLVAYRVYCAASDATGGTELNLEYSHFVDHTRADTGYCDDCDNGRGY